MTAVLETNIAWGDCDENGIVFFPNYFYWMDSAFHALLQRAGVDQRTINKRFGAWTPVLEITGRFLKSATYGEPLQVDAILDSWQNKTFRVKYVGRRNDDLLFEGHDVRVWAVRGPDGKLKAMPIPDEFRAALGAPIPPPHA